MISLPTNPIRRLSFFGDNVPNERVNIAMEAAKGRDCFPCSRFIKNDHVCFPTCQVAWDKTDLLQKMKHVSPWLVELVSNIPSIHERPFLPPRKKLRIPDDGNQLAVVEYVEDLSAHYRRIYVYVPLVPRVG